MIVAVGTRRRPKIEALKQVFSILSERYPEFSRMYLNQYDVDSGVSETPTTLAELMFGAKNRAIAMINRQLKADYYIGMEGGIFHQELEGETLPFLQSWAYVSNGEVGYFGASQALQLPSMIDHRVSVEGRSLSEVTDEFSGKTNVREHNGTFGVLTDNIITRTGVFVQALLTAFAPFYVQKYRW